MEQDTGYVDAQYLQATAEKLLQLKRFSYDLMHVEPGSFVMDVGCGPGSDTIPLAELVGPTGRVFGVDHDAEMIAAADDRARQKGVSEVVTHKAADATALPFDAASVDACRSERLFQHLLHPEVALSEMVRVTRPGGWIVVLDTDWGTTSIDSSQTEIERTLARVVSEQSHRNGYSGRQLYRLFKKQGLLDIKVDMLPAYVTSYPLGRVMGRLGAAEQAALNSNTLRPQDIERWHAELEAREAEGTFFGTVSLVVLSGRKPE